MCTLVRTSDIGASAAGHDRMMGRFFLGIVILSVAILLAMYLHLVSQ